MQTRINKQVASWFVGLGGLLLVPWVAVSSAGAQAGRDTTRADTAVRLIDKVVVEIARMPAVTGGASAVEVDIAALHLPPAPALQDVLRQTPFVLVRQNSRGEAELSMRGSESRQMAISLDGLPLSLGWDHRSDPSLIPVTGVQSVKLVRGLSSLLHGPNVLGGTVELGLGGGTAGALRRSELTLSSGVDADGALAGDVVAGYGASLSSGGTLSLRAGAGFRDREGVAMPNDVADQYASGALRSNSALTQRDGFAALRWSRSDGSYAGVTASGYRTERGVAPELHIQGPRFWKYPNQARTLAALSAGSALVRTPLGFGRLDVSGGYTRGTVHIQAFEDDTYSTIDSEERGDERLTTGRLLLTHSFMFNGTIKAAFTGGKVQYEEILGSTHSDFEQRLWSSGVELEIPLSESMIMSGGLVSDASTTPKTAGRQALPRRAAPGWRLGASISVMDDIARVHASVSERSRFPALRELYSGSLERFEPNPELRPETLLGGEVGFSIDKRYGSARSLSLQAVLFHHALSDAVVRTTFENSNRFIRVNRDRVNATGLELFGSLAAVENGISLSGDLMIQSINIENRITNVPLQLEHQPEFKARLEFGAPLPYGTQGFASARHTGVAYCLHPDSGNLVDLRAQSAFDLAFSRVYRVRSTGLLSSLRARLAIDNVTDAAVYDACGLPQAGRTFRLGFQLF